MAKSTILESMPAKLGAAARRSGMPISPGWRRNERKRLWTATPPWSPAIQPRDWRGLRDIRFSSIPCALWADREHIRLFGAEAKARGILDGPPENPSMR